MSRTLQEKHHLYTFIDGLVTENTPLTQGENIISAGDNIDISVTGKASRRLGIDFESGFGTSLTTSLNENILQYAAISIHEWKNVNGYGGLNFLMVQGERELWFFDMAKDPLSGGYLAKFDLTSFIVRGNPGDIVKQVFDTSSLDGRLFVATGITEPLVIEYQEATNELVMYSLTIRIRDDEGVDDGLAPDERPTVLSREHEYNLMNQGWIDPIDSGVNTTVGTTGNASTDFTELDREVCAFVPVVPS